MKIYEMFAGIDGEVNFFGQGHTSFFIRLAGCNLNCVWCDAPDARKSKNRKNLSIRRIYSEFKKTGLDKITITGGEPTLQDFDLSMLIRYFIDQKPDIKISIEMNGTQNINLPFENISKIVDFKSPSSGIEFDKDKFIADFKTLTKKDYIKFCIADKNDYKKAKMIYNDYKSLINCKFAFSPVILLTSDIENGRWLAEQMVKDRIDGIFNLQIHKFLNMR